MRRKNFSTYALGDIRIPLLFALSGEEVANRFKQLFEVGIRNPNTRRAYYRAVCDFAQWCEQHHLSLQDIRADDVAKWVESQSGDYSASTRTLRLTGVRHLFEWLVSGGILEVNPALRVSAARLGVRRKQAD